MMMKKLEKMSDKERKNALAELVDHVQEVCDFEPAMKSKGKSEKQLKEMLEEAYHDLEPEDFGEDKITEENVAVFDQLGFTEEEPEKKAEGKEKSEKKTEGKEKTGAKKEKTMASILDELIEEGGSFESIAKKAQKAVEKRGGATKYSPGGIRSHLKFRLQQDPKWLKSRKLKQTDDGIE